MAVKVLFEVGSTSKLKSKQTPDGFTHDWELYVRGTDKNDISHFVDKVVFNLHESFPKPKRVLKEAPYVLKESGYAGFLVPTEIHFKARDQPKVTFTYDLQLQNAGPPMHRSEIKKFTFNNPSEDFRRKLLKGGGTSLVNNTADDKSRDSLDERSQPMSKPKATNEDLAKKHKIRPEESKLQTFAKLFGPPITKATSKVSPDTKTKSSPSPVVPCVASKSSKSSDKSSATSSVPKEKSDKPDKKDKHKHSPHKEKYEAKETKKNEEKHDRREEKKKDKSHSKERDRSRDKVAKRPPSPKRPPPSPKRSSPVRSSSAASRGDTNGYKAAAKTHSEPVGLNNNAEKVATSSSSGKKSKKEKKSYDKDRDKEKGKDKERDRKEKPSDDRSSNNSTPVVPAVLPAIYHNSSGAQTNNSKLPSNDVKASGDFVKNKEKELMNSGSSKDTAKESNKKSNVDTSSNVNESKKSAEKHDKDSEKRHKHKKKDKNKEKEKEKDHNSSKDNKKKDKSTKKDDLKKTPQVANEAPSATSQKSNATPLSTLLHGISDDDTRDSITESVSASVSERHESFAESSNSSVTDIAAKAASAAAIASAHQPPPPPAPAPPPEEAKPDKKERKTREKTKPEKDEKKRKRKSKDDVDTSHKATPPPVLVPEPPMKQLKKDELIVKNGDRSNSPHLSHINSNSSIPNPSPKGQLIMDDSKAFRTPNAANVPLPSTSATSVNSNTSQTANHPDRSFPVDYIAELRELQQKIMTLQDSNDLQQVVELIAPTGRFEITSKSFDFDLCTLDRITVQKLQDFFATSCS